MILMTKKEAERQLNKQLTNQEYNKYIYDLNFKNKKETHKKVQIKTVKAPLNFNDAKNEFLQVNNLDEKSYESKCYEYVLKFDNNFLCFDKPSIKTSFCFGYGQNGITTEDYIDRAYGQQRNMETNKQAFINANLEGLNKSIKDIETFISQWIDKEEKFLSSRYNKIFICKNSYNHLAYLAWSWDYDNIRNKDMIIREATKEDLLKYSERFYELCEICDDLPNVMWICTTEW